MAGNVDMVLEVGMGSSRFRSDVNRNAAYLRTQMNSAMNSTMRGANAGFSLDSRQFTQPLGKITGDLSQFQSSLQASTARVLAFGATASVLAGVITGFKKIVSSTIEVEKALISINSLLNLSEEKLGSFSTEMFSVAKRTAQSFGEVAKAAGEFARQGLSAEETIKRVGDALILTRLSGLSAVTAVDTLTAAVNGFRNEAIDTSDVVNRLANVDANFAVSSADLSEALSRTASTAQSAKVSFNELIAVTTAVQQITARGGSVIGNSFKTIFTRLQRSGVREQLEKIGVATTDANGDFRNAIDILKDYASVYESLSDQQQAYTSEQIAGVRQVNNLKALINDLNSEYSIYSRALNIANDTTDEAYLRNERLNESLSSLIERTKASGVEFGSVFGEGAFGPGIKNLLLGINSITESLSKMFDKNNDGIVGGIAKGLLTGLGDFLAGPGLAILGKSLFNLFRLLGRDIRTAFKQVLDLSKGFVNIQKTSEAITFALGREKDLYRELIAATGDQARQNAIIEESLKRQLGYYNQQLSTAKAVHSYAVGGALAVSGSGSVGFRVGGKGLLSPRYASGGPRLTRGLSASVKKEHIEGGVPYSKIRAHFDKNGYPLAVTNTRDEPRGLRDIKYKVPNFSKTSLADSSFTDSSGARFGSATLYNNAQLQSKFQAELGKIIYDIHNFRMSMEDGNAAFKKLSDEYRLSAKSHSIARKMIERGVLPSNYGKQTVLSNLGAQMGSRPASSGPSIPLTGSSNPFFAPIAVAQQQRPILGSQMGSRSSLSYVPSEQSLTTVSNPFMKPADPFANRQRAKPEKQGLGIGAYFAAQMIAGLLKQASEGKGGATGAVAGGLSSGISAATTSKFLFGATTKQSIGVASIIALSSAVLNFTDRSDDAQKSLDKYTAKVKENADAASGAISTAELLNAAYESGDENKIKKLSERFSELTKNIDNEDMRKAFNSFSGNMEDLQESLSKYAKEAEMKKKELEKELTATRATGASGFAYNIKRSLSDPIGAIFGGQEINKKILENQKKYRSDFSEEVIQKNTKDLFADGFNQDAFDNAKRISAEFGSLMDDFNEISEITERVKKTSRNGVVGEFSEKLFEDSNRLKELGAKTRSSMESLGYSDKKIEEILKKGSKFGFSVASESKSGFEDVVTEQSLRENAFNNREAKKEVDDLIRSANEGISKALKDSLESASKVFKDMNYGIKYKAASMDKFQDISLENQSSSGMMSPFQVAEIKRKREEFNINAASLGDKTSSAIKIIQDRGVKGKFSYKDGKVSGDNSFEADFLNNLLKTVSSGGNIDESIQAYPFDEGSDLPEIVEEIKKANEEADRNAALQLRELKTQSELLKQQERNRISSVIRGGQFFNNRGVLGQSQMELGKAFKTMSTELLNSVKSVFSLTGSAENPFSKALNAFTENRTSLVNINDMLMGAGISPVSRLQEYNGRDNTESAYTVNRNPYQMAKEQYARANKFLIQNEDAIEKARQRVLKGNSTAEDLKLTQRASRAYEAREASQAAGMDYRRNMLSPEQRAQESKTAALRTTFGSLSYDDKIKFSETYKGLTGSLLEDERGRLNERKISSRDVSRISNIDFTKLFSEFGGNGSDSQFLSTMAEDVGAAMTKALEGKTFDSISKNLIEAIEEPSKRLVMLQDTLANIAQGGFKAVVDFNIYVNGEFMNKTKFEKQSGDGPADVPSSDEFTVTASAGSK